MATDGDQIFVYTGDDTNPFFIFGLSTVPWVTEGSTVGTTTSVLPLGLADSGVNASIAFDDVDNGQYAGRMAGSQETLLDNICNTQQWSVSDSDRYSSGDIIDFDVYSSKDTRTPTARVTSNPTGVPTVMDKKGNNASNRYGSLRDQEFTILVVCLPVAILTTLFAIWLWIHRCKPMSKSTEERLSLYEVPDAGHQQHSQNPLTPSMVIA